MRNRSVKLRCYGTPQSLTTAFLSHRVLGKLLVEVLK